MPAEALAKAGIPKLLVLSFVLLFAFDQGGWCADSGWLTPTSLTVIIGGREIRDRTHALVKGAARAVQIEMFEFGDATLTHLVCRQWRGDRDVKVIMDRTVEMNRDTRRMFDGEGVPTRFFPTLEPRVINHVKLLVVDGTTALIGGANWGTFSPRNFDVAAEVGGVPAVFLARCFESDWAVSQARPPLSISLLGSVSRPTGKVRGARVRVVSDGDIRPLLLAALQEATRSITVGMYVLTERAVVKLLIAKRAEGLHVRVMLDAVQASNPPTALALDRGGVPVRWYQSTDTPAEKFHVKTVVCDDEVAFIGSANATYFGLHRNHECDIVLLTRDAVKPLCNALDQVWTKRSRPVVNAP